MAFLASACAIWAEGRVTEETKESKEKLKLQYDVAVHDNGNGRVTVTFTLADEGRLKPITGIYLYIPAEKAEKDGGRYADLWLSLATRVADGKQVATFELRRDWAQRAEIQLMSRTLDGKLQDLGSDLYTIHVAKYLDSNAMP